MNLTREYTSCRPQKQPGEVLYKKKMFLKISQNSQENTGVGVSYLINLQAKKEIPVGFLSILGNF